MPDERVLQRWFRLEMQHILDLDMIGINWPVRAPIYVSQNNAVLWSQLQTYAKELKIPSDMIVAKNISLGSSDFAVWMKASPMVPGIFMISDFSECAVPTPVENPAPVPGVPCSYPFWHWQDTVETMTAMAGGSDMLAKGFQTALNLSIFVLGVEALHPEIKL